jgi:hypothetical protein
MRYCFFLNAISRQPCIVCELASGNAKIKDSGQSSHEYDANRAVTDTGLLSLASMRSTEIIALYPLRRTLSFFLNAISRQPCIVCELASGNAKIKESRPVSVTALSAIFADNSSRRVINYPDFSE